ncbi:MAG: hydroxymethylglutaryl-CoA reductase, degradative [Candidatus Hodarchaeota archaeon]
MSERQINSRISGFFRKTLEERQSIIKNMCQLADTDIEYLNSAKAPLEDAGKGYYIENVIGAMTIPLGIATNFQINGKDYLIPMAIEEASVVAAAANSARVARASGGFFTSSTPPIMIGQIQVVELADPWAAKARIHEREEEIIKLANDQDPILIKFGGGCKGIQVKVLENTKTVPMLVVELLVDCRDAMGANAVNTMNEACAPLIEEITGGRVFLRIISNLADKRLVRARAVFLASQLATDEMTGEEVINGILHAYAFAETDPYRNATHVKGIMNGIDSVAVALAQDWRAIEAGAHAYAATKEPGRYSSITHYEKNENGDLVGTIELPMAVGTVGGVASVHPIAQISQKILAVKSANELAEVMACIGLAQNFGALRALATKGIQMGHMKLHARNLAASLGATSDEIERVLELITERIVKVTYDNIKILVEEVKK